MASSSPSEHEIQQRIRLACSCGAVRLWRNNTGALVAPQERFVRFGLCKGSSDLIGLCSLQSTPELVGQQLAQFVAVEGVQTPTSPRRRSLDAQQVCSSLNAGLHRGLGALVHTVKGPIGLSRSQRQRKFNPGDAVLVLSGPRTAS
jgi:hypothetical protein